MRIRLAVVVFIAALATPMFAQEQRLAANAFPLPVPHYLASIINEAAQTYGVDPNLIAAVAFHESAFKTNAVSSYGAQGLMQLLPNTARSLGVVDSFDARANIFGGTKYLRKQLDRFGGDVDRALAAYNVGPETVKKAGAAATPGAVRYVATVKGFYYAALRAL